LLAAAAVMASGPRALAKDSPALDLARQLNEAFVEVADQVSPAVVVIDIRQKVNDKETDDGGSFWDILPPELRRHFQHGMAAARISNGSKGKAPASLFRPTVTS
jgi:S1-C subfamily serine protease